MPEAADITIGRCDLRIRRPRGSATPWLGEGDHRAMADRVRVLVLSMLEEILLQKIGEQSDDISDIYIEMTLSADDLRGAAPLARPSLRARLDAALSAGITRAQPAETPAPTPDGRLADALVSRKTARAPTNPIRRRSIARLLSALFARSDPPSQLDAFGEAQLLALLREVASELGLPALRPGAAAPNGRTGAPDPAAAREQALDLLRQAAASLGTARPGVSGLDQTARGRLMAELRRFLDNHPDFSLLAPPEAGAASTTSATFDGAPGVSAATPRARPRTNAVGTAEHPDTSDPAAGLPTGRYALEHALPVLALARLAHHGLCDALALDLPKAASIILACVAAKAQPWGTDRAAARGAAAAAVGLHDAPRGAEVAGLARDARAPLTRAAIAELLLPSLGPGLSLPLVADPETLVLFDPAGLSPVAEGEFGEVLPALLRAGRLLCLSPSEGPALDRLDIAGLVAFAEGPPPRRSEAVPVAGPGGWAGHATAAAALPFALRARLPAEAEIAGRASEVWRSLLGNAPVVAEAGAGPETRTLERLVTLMAGFALADIGWALSLRDPASWRAPDPLLVQARFANLSATLTVTADEAVFTLPMGRRFTDLRDAGLLRPVEGWPGWHGRRIRITGG